MNVYTASSFEKTINRTTTHQYLVRKYGNKSNEQYFNFEEILNQIQDVFCMSCESYVPSDQIDIHTQNCNGECDQYEQVDSLQAKLQKCNFLINKIKKMLKTYSSDQQYIIQYLQMLWKCCSNIILASDYDVVSQCLDDLDLFQQYFENQQQDIAVEQVIQQILTIISKIMQFSERKARILQSNQNNVINHLKESIATSLANEGGLQKKLQIHDNQLNRYRNPFENVQNNIHQSLKDDFQSRFKQANKQSLSPITETSFIEKSKIGTLTPRMEESMQLTQTMVHKSEAEKKNQFFKIAAFLKKKFPQKQSVQQALIIALYDTANKLNIQQNQYENYIINLYQNM
ncbi:unnamed protein product [Paramecium octaurelia]|uniref:Uncharacterized protein n=1 Tax=Paramecium octaurelia TaxID=43137 RepID=A0A8S1USM6_PAROT|nr:unnamed protein product [Paramecium octaurelia]